MSPVLRISLAPEVLNNEWYTHAIDWWALGILTFALLLGQVRTVFFCSKL